MHCKSMQCMSTSIRNGKAAVAAHVQTKAKLARAAMASPRTEARAWRKNEKPVSKFEGECRYCQKKGHKKADCRRMNADLAAGKCDKHCEATEDCGGCFGRVSSIQNDAEHDSSSCVQTGLLRSEPRRAASSTKSSSTKICLNFDGSTGRSTRHRSNGDRRH